MEEQISLHNTLSKQVYSLVRNAIATSL